MAGNVREGHPALIFERNDVAKSSESRLEKIAASDLRKRNRTVKLVRHWQRRLWRETADALLDRDGRPLRFGEGRFG